MTTSTALESDTLQQPIHHPSHLVFTYGTLMRGFGNHYYLDGAEFICKAQTPAAFTMLNLGAFPGIVAKGDTSIVGEVYRVDEQTLMDLDRLEGHPTFYLRQIIGPLRLINSEMMACLDDVMAYVLPEKWLDSRQIIESGDWRKR